MQTAPSPAGGEGWGEGRSSRAPARHRSWRPLLFIAIVLAALAILLTPAARADGPAVVRASQAQVDFPRGVSFRLEAESTAEIREVQLQVNTPGQRYGAAVRNVRPTFTPGQQVSATWTWPRFGNVLPPGAEITYRWRITDADGRVTETAQESVRVQDSRHQWRELSDGPFTVRWYRGDERFGRDLLAATREGAARLRELAGVDLRYPLTVHIYGSQSELGDALPGVPGWAGGIAIPEFDTVMIGIEPGNLPWGRRALTHELAHQLVYQMTAHPTLGSRVPTWLNEGLAVVAEGETERRNRQLVEDAVEEDALPTLRNLATPFSGRGSHLAGVAYAASESAVRFLLDEYGPERMRTLLLTLSEGTGADEAVRRAYGRSPDELEDAWRTDLGLRPFERGRAGSVEPLPGDDPAAASEARRKTADDVAPWAAWGLLLLGALTLIAGGVVTWRLLRLRVST